MPTAPPRCCGGNVFPHPMFPFTRTPSLPRRPMRRDFLSEFALAFPLPLPYELWVHYFRFFGLPRLPASGSRLSVKSFGDVGWWGVARARGVETSTSTRILLPKRSRAPVASGLWPPAGPFVPWCATAYRCAAGAPGCYFIRAPPVFPSRRRPNFHSRRRISSLPPCFARVRLVS